MSSDGESRSRRRFVFCFFFVFFNREVPRSVTFASYGPQFTGDDVKKNINYPEKGQRNQFIVSLDAPSRSPRRGGGTELKTIAKKIRSKRRRDVTFFFFFAL